MTDRLRLIDSDLEAVTLGRLPQRRRHLAGHRRLAGRATSRARRAGPSTSPRARSRRPTPRRWTSPRAPAWSASSPTCPAGLVPRTARPRRHRRARRADRATTTSSTSPCHDDRRPRTILPGRTASAGSRTTTSAVRDVHAATGSPDDDRSIDDLLDEVAEHDTVVLGRSGEDPRDDDPRARIPAWEDIVFGVRRHR